MTSSPLLLRCERGAAMAEAVVALVPLLLAFGLLIYLAHGYGGRASAKALARGCSWAHSLGACKVRALPAVCRVQGVHRRLGAPERPVDEASGIGASARAAAEAVASLGQALLRIEAGGEMRVDAKVRRPGILGGGRQTVRARFHLRCNEASTSPIELAWTAMCQLSEEIPGCPD